MSDEPFRALLTKAVEQLREHVLGERAAVGLLKRQRDRRERLDPSQHALPRLRDGKESFGAGLLGLWRCGMRHQAQCT